MSVARNDESSYSSEPFDIPSGDFKIFIEGRDSNKNPIFKEFIIDDIDNGNDNGNKDEFESILPMIPKEEKEMQDLLKIWKYTPLFKKIKGGIISSL